MQTPLVSILLPVYQGQNYIRNSINSVLSQSFRNYELLIVDNNSSDSTESIVKEFDDNRIKYIKNHTNIGAINNWNLALTLSRGKYLKLICHDDLINPDCLRKQVEILEEDVQSEISLVFSSRLIIDEKDNVIFVRNYPFKKSGIIDKNQIRQQCVRYGTNLLGEPGSVLFRSSLYKKIGGFDTKNSYLADLDFWFRLLEFGDAFYIKEPLFSFRILKNSLGDSTGFNQAKSFILFVKNYKNNNPALINKVDYLIGIFTSYLNMFARRYIYFVK